VIRSFQVSASYVPTTHDRVGVQESLDESVRRLRSAGAEDVFLTHDPGSRTFTLWFALDCGDAPDALIRQVGMATLESVCQFSGMDVQFGAITTHPREADTEELARPALPEIDLTSAAPEYIDLDRTHDEEFMRAEDEGS
jgi:hypothetical protein